MNLETFGDKKIVDIIPSKSDAHRAIICNALTDHPCRIEMGETSVDIEATRECMEALKSASNDVDLYCHESGTTLRLLLPIVGAIGKKGIFHPEGRLGQRPLSPLKEELEEHGMRISNSKGGDDEVIVAEGRLVPGEYELPGDVSSQFISGLLLALPILDGDSRLTVRGKIESAGYIDMTLKTIEKFGVRIEVRDSGSQGINSQDSGSQDKSLQDSGSQDGAASREYIIKGSQKYIAPDVYKVEGDWSNAAPWLVASDIMGFPIEVRGLDLTSAQGDKAIVDIINKIKNNIGSIDIDVSQTPDLVPMIALAATQGQGRVRITNAERLRIKESDRLHTVAENLSILGADIKELDDGLEIQGPTKLRGGKVNSYNDHRIAMMCAIASIVASDKVVLSDPYAINKSYPGFYEVLDGLGLGDNLEKDL